MICSDAETAAELLSKYGGLNDAEKLLSLRPTPAQLAMAVARVKAEADESIKAIVRYFNKQEQESK